MVDRPLVHTNGEKIGIGCVGDAARGEPLREVSRVADRRQAVGLRRDVPEERPPGVLAEEDVLAQERLGKAVDRGERRAQLM